MGLTSHEYNIVLQRLLKLEREVQCLNKSYDALKACCDDTPTPEPECNDVVISVQPQGGSVLSGGNFTMSVVASGDAPITYQWKKGGVAIQGATSASYSIVGAVSGSAGSYTVTLTNPCNSVTSDAVTLSVTTPVVTSLVYWGWTDNPSITSMAQVQALQYSAQKTSGQNISVSFTANTSPKYLVMFEPSTEPLKVKWYGSDLNNGNIGTSNDLFPAPVTVSNYRGYITVYPTQQTQTPIVFKTS